MNSGPVVASFCGTSIQECGTQMRFWFKAMLVILYFGGAASSLADISGALDSQAELSPFYLRVGTYVLDSSTIAEVDGLGGNLGSRLDFEDDLNLDERKNTLLAAARWRFRDRHFLEIEYFNLKRYGTKRIEEEIRFGETVFPITAQIDSSFTTEVTRLSYAYRVVRHPDWGLALSAGLHLTRLRTVLNGTFTDDVDAPVFTRELASVTAPLPVFGLSGARRLSEKWTFLARGQWFFLEVDDVAGAITHAAVHFEHSTFDNIGLGIGYDWFDIDVDLADALWRGTAEVRFKGPMIFLQGSF
jgi:hypothetical protein